MADKGYYKGEEIVACELAGIAVTVSKPNTSNAGAVGRFDKPTLYTYLTMTTECSVRLLGSTIGRLYCLPLVAMVETIGQPADGSRSDKHTGRLEIRLVLILMQVNRDPGA